MQTDPDSIEWRLDFEGSAEPESLWLRIEPVSGSPIRVIAKPPADPVEQSTVQVDISTTTPVAGAAQAAGDAGDDSAEPELSTRYSLQLVGLGLFRIDGARMPGLDEWTIWLDDWGWPVRSASTDDVDEGSCLAIRSQSGTGQLEFRAAGAREFRPVPALPFELEAKAGGKLRFVPPPDPRRYLALLMLNASVALPVSRTPLSLGRATTSHNAEPDLPIDLLDHPRSAKWAEGARGAGACLDVIDLSRRHVTVRLVEHQLEVAMTGGRASAFALDREGSARTELLPKSPVTATLDPGEHLLLGGYVLRFQRDKAHTGPSSGGHQRLRETK